MASKRGGTTTGKGGMKKSASSHSTSSYSLESTVGCVDMVLLDPLTEDNLVDNLKQRYDTGEIYTYIGHVVISVNPYAPLSIYTPEYVSEYRSRNIFELPPHIFAISDSAYRSMRDMHQDQCVIISGESGAGKTEASKRVMQYLASVSGKGQEVDTIKEQLLQSNPVLEAFGNAKTNRNDNSSRFGKYMDIEFDFKGEPVGGIVTNYLLEKSRVIGQANGERNFHIFFQILSGLPDEFLDMLHLQRDTTMYQYLNQSDCSKVKSINDSKQFDNTMKAMEVVGFSADEISAMLELLAAILNLGNVSFEGYSLPNGTDACRLVNQEAVSYACDMLGCSVKLLEQCLIKKSVETSRDVILTPLSAAEGALARDGLSKAIYDRMFSWIVRRINDSIKTKSYSKRKSMGVLDIYGFEIFETNSFEQFMINYCNERIQQLFVDLTLCTEQQEYIREGIEWEPVEYFDNSIICELIEDPAEGILALLDDECLRPGEANDGTFLNRLNKTWVTHEHYISRESRDHLSDQTLSREQFRLVHYAGEVNYDVVGFLDKNKDKLFKDLSQAMFACERPMLKELFPEGDPDAANLKRPSTTGYQFKTSVSELMKNLLSKNPNYIRCIKPNEYQRPRKFNSTLVAAQTRYLGLLENIRVRRAGYAFRQSFDQALQRYKMLSTRTWPKWKRSPRDGIKAIMVACGKTPEEFALGRTKLFIRNPTTVFDLEERRKKRMIDLAVLIQKVYRGWIQCKKYRKLKKAQITFSKHYRSMVCRRHFNKIRNSTIVVQKFYRGWQVRNEVKKFRYMASCTWASYIIRNYYYSWKLRKEINNRAYAKKGEPAAIVIQAYYRGWKVRKRINGVKAETAGPLIMRFIRRALAYRFLVTLAKNLPTQSPLDKRWPRCSPLFKRTSFLLRKMYHSWRCSQLRKYYKDNPLVRRRVMEKARASSFFRGKKTNYTKTVSVAFKQDRIGLRGNDRWNSIATSRADQRVVWADAVQKLNKSDTKLSQKILVVTAASFFILDPKNYSLQYQMPLSDLEAISVSPHSDHFFIIHLKPTQSRSKTAPKGDFIFQVSNCIEAVTKTILIVQEVEKRIVKLSITDQVSVRFRHGSDPTAVRFQPSSGVLSTSPLCKRKGNHLTLSVLP